MKKEYEAPRAEKMEFDYEENVVASNISGATNQVHNEWSGEHGNGKNKSGCVKC